VDQHEQVARWLGEARAAAAFTGAGMSRESGIPDLADLVIHASIGETLAAIDRFFAE
jgi:hypothetical protein